MAVIPVAGLPGLFEQSTVTVRTWGASTRDRHGHPVETGTDTTIQAPVHPTGRKQLERLDLDSKRETISVYATVAIGSNDDTVRPPVLGYQGRWYEIVSVADYLTTGGVYMVHAALLDREPT